MKTPCQHCEARKPGCHSECERYKEYRAVCDACKAKRKKESIMTEYGIDKGNEALKKNLNILKK